MSYELGVLALVWVEADGRLGVRQKEQLRRALIASGECLDWATMVPSASDPISKATKELTKLTKKGSKMLTEELAEELANKKAEMKVLKKVSKSLRKMAEKDDFDGTVEVEYIHTARNGSQGYQTKIETTEVNNAKEAGEAADSIDKKLEAWDKLREHMLVDIKKRQKKVEEMKDRIPDFVESTKSLLHEVFATLH